MGNTTTMIQAKYEPAFAALTPAMLERVMVGLSATRPELHELGDIEDGPTLVDYCRQSGISQAEVVMSMRNDPSPLAVAAVECLLMKPIDRRTPAEVERQRDAERPGPSWPPSAPPSARRTAASSVCSPPATPSAPGPTATAASPCTGTA